MKELFKMLISPYDFLYEEHDMAFTDIHRRGKSDTWYVKLKIDNRLIFGVNAINTSNINTYLMPCDKSGKPLDKYVRPSFMKQYLLNEEYYEHMKAGEKQAVFLMKNMNSIFSSFEKSNIAKTYECIGALKSKNVLERDWVACPEEVRSIRFKQITVLDHLPAFQGKTAKESVLELVDSPHYAQENAKHHIRRALLDSKYEPTQVDIDRVLTLPLIKRFNTESVLACLKK